MADSKKIHTLIVGAGTFCLWKLFLLGRFVVLKFWKLRGNRYFGAARCAGLEKGTHNLQTYFPPLRQRTNKTYKAGLPYTIFESETSSTYQTRPREWGMTLHWGSEHIAKCLPPELVERMTEAYADPTLSPDAVTGLPIYNGKTGELVMEMKAEQPCRVSRKKMRNLFAEGLEIQYGKELVSIEEIKNKEGKGGVRQVRLIFKDGTKATGDIVVGCDGARSRTRECICGKEEAALTEVPLSMFNFTQKFTAEQALELRKLNPLFITSIHPDHGTMFWISSKISRSAQFALPFRITVTPQSPTTTSTSILIILQYKTFPRPRGPKHGPSSS